MTMDAAPQAPCRLFAILARLAPRAVIFRRGPTDWTQIILWETDADKFQFGQWFRGRIYERRSDLSPDGTKLIYFAHKITKRTLVDHEYTYAWTAVSKPPYLTALALWPKGDCWHGGGLFEDNGTVFLNHRPEQATPHPNHIPSGLVVHSNPSAHGEDGPIYNMRLDRDGWKVEQEWKTSYRGYPDFYLTEIPEIRVRSDLSGDYRIVMTRRIDGLNYRESFAVVNQENQSVVDANGVQWGDWDQRGRLVLFRAGSIWIEEARTTGEFAMRELADLNPHKPEAIIAPSWATEW